MAQSLALSPVSRHAFVPAAYSQIDNAKREPVKPLPNPQPTYPSDAAIQSTGHIDTARLIAVQRRLDQGLEGVFPSRCAFNEEHTGFVNDVVFVYKEESWDQKNGSYHKQQIASCYRPSLPGTRDLRILFSLNSLGQDIEQRYPNLPEHIKLRLLQQRCQPVGINQFSTISALQNTGMWTAQTVTVLTAGQKHLPLHVASYPGDLIEAIVPDSHTLAQLGQNPHQPVRSAVKLFLQPKRSRTIAEEMRVNMERMILVPEKDEVPELRGWHQVKRAESQHAFMAFAAFLTEMSNAGILDVQPGEKFPDVTPDVEDDNDKMLAMLAYMFGYTKPSIIDKSDKAAETWRSENAEEIEGIKRQVLGRLWKTDAIPGNLAFGYNRKRKHNVWITEHTTVEKGTIGGELLQLQLRHPGTYVEAVSEAIHDTLKNVIGTVTVGADPTRQQGDVTVGVLLT